MGTMIDKLFGRKRKEETVEVVKNENSATRIAVGLDIGTTKVVAFAGKRNANGKIDILGYGKQQSVGVQRGLVINIDQTSNAIRKVVKLTEDNANIEIDTVMVGIAGQHIINHRMMGEIKRDNTDNVISQNDIKRLIEDMFKTPVDPGKQVLDVIPQEYIVDNYPKMLNPIGVLGRRLSSEFNVITGDAQHIRNIGRCIKNCNLTMDGLVLEPIASAEVVLDKDEKETGVALVDIGGGTTDVVVFIDGVMRHTAVIPIASDVITDDIKNVFKGIVKEQAELLKIKHGSCIPDESTQNQVISIPGIHGRPATEISEYELAQVIQARVGEIIDRIKEELKNANCFDKLGCGIVFTGGGSKLKGLKEMSEMRTGLLVRIGNPEEKINIHDKEYSDPIFSTGLGLMILGIERDEELNGRPDLSKEYINSTQNQEESDINDEDIDDDDFDDSQTRQKANDRNSNFAKYRPWGIIQSALAALIESDDDDDDEDDEDDDFDRV